ncbi:Very-long-chain 3-ketoacyl-CoA synthase [Trema orientale]|uniref:3-ketoacyl-CoA synthase n=1 Tax=Trema orientale TaxID=63057 RepID=A0A2P5AWY9_TREOI|nr:Very-long-chain 3-ketoacyl-CoA synthase [Trema orientale]
MISQLAHFHLAAGAAATTTIIILVILYFSTKSQPVYLVDFACYRPPDSLRAPLSNFIEHSERCGCFTPESVAFQEKVLLRSGIGNESCVPVSLHEVLPTPSIHSAKAEIEQVLFTIVKQLLSKQKITNPKTIDILVTNCSLFCPTPSISSMIINKFGFRSDVKSFSLSGMGCSAGILAISLAKDLLKVHKNSIALVLSMEAVSPNGYQGQVKSMLMSNVLFRMGGAAVLLSSQKIDKPAAKYELRYLVRTHTGSDDQAYQSVFQHPDDNGLVGVSISRSLIHVAAKTLTINMSKLGPLVLPYSEQFRYGLSAIFRRIRPSSSSSTGLYVPNFRRAFKHFCIHAGGRAVIDALEDSLKLRKEDGEASRMTLYRFGNTSSSSIWYELCYLEAKGRVKKGDRVWQIAFGSGFKCNSAVWKCISDIDPSEPNAWSDRISLYPVDIPNVS